MPNRILIWCYLIFGAAAAGFLLFAERCCRAADKSYGVIRNACILFVCTILAYAISISVFPFPSQPAIFFPLSLVLVCVLFILPFYTMTFLLTGAFFVFLVLVLLFKTPRSISYDLFSGVTALILVYFLLYIITDLRLRSGESLVKLEVLNRTDPLTGLPNRRWASENMPPCFRRCQKMQLPVAAMMLDIDDFKKYNDTLGHQAGDTCLKIIGEIILSYSRDLGIRAARYGGEEFLFLLGDCSKKEALSAAWGPAGACAGSRNSRARRKRHGKCRCSRYVSFHGQHHGGADRPGRRSFIPFQENRQKSGDPGGGGLRGAVQLSSFETMPLL